MTRPAARAREQLRERHSFGFVCLLLALVLLWAIAAPAGEWPRVVLIVLQAAALITAAWTSAAAPRVQRAVALVALVGILAAVSVALGTGGGIEGETSGLGALLVVLTPLLMLSGLRDALRNRGVTLQVVFGAIALYLLLGIFCASVYGLIARYGADTLFADGNGDGTLSEHFYFAFITQATVGYGDFAPASSVARATAVFQALAGQLYLVTVLALLVSNLGRGPRRGEADAERPEGAG